jgi:hypothetical protein
MMWWRRLSGMVVFIDDEGNDVVSGGSGVVLKLREGKGGGELPIN